MGTKFFSKRGSGINPSSGTNLQARAIGASSFAGRAAAGGASKDLAAAMALSKHMGKAPSKTVISNLKGPKV